MPQLAHLNVRALSNDHALSPDRCPRCYMRNEVCICELIPAIQNETLVTVLMHHRESHKTTNTGRLACLALQRSEIRLRGLKDAPLHSSGPLCNAGYQPVLLTLSERSSVLSPGWLSQFNKPIQLIVPDGNWRQAGKMGRRETELQSIPWIKLPPGPPSRYRLRHEHLPEGMATLEAIARALGIIEAPHVQTQLEAIFNIMVERTLSTRPPVAQFER